METIIKALIDLLEEKPYNRDEILFIVQKVRQELLLATGQDNGDYDKWSKGKLEFGNLRKYSVGVSDIIKEYCVSKEVLMSDDEYSELAEKIKNFTINQNLM